MLDKYGFNKKTNLHIVETDGGCGSAYAQWILRKEFLNVTNGNPNAFAILLDQDDVLCCDAARNIEAKMNENSVVISKFNITGETNKDITSDGGKNHNDIIAGLGSIRKKCHQLSTIGWTKAYSRKAMFILINDLELYFKNHTKLGAENFFKKYKAYEDFLDFYILLNNGVSVIKNNFVTHQYFKNSESITSQPSLNAFRYERAEMLVNLSKLCNVMKNELCNGWEEKLVLFLKTKIYDIEKILRKYRIEAEKNNELNNEFLKNTYDGWFVDLLLSKDSNDYLMNAAEMYRNVFYDETVDSKIKKKTIYYSVSSKYDNIKTPKQKQFEKSKKYLIFGIIILILFLLGYITLCLTGKFEFSKDFPVKVITLFFTLLTILIEYRRHLEMKADEEASFKSLYFSEFEDMIRHIEANLKVAIEIRKEIDLKYEKPMDIHFTNFKWPEKSSLFLEKIVTLIDKSKLDDFSRLRMNLRNMNNSAQWLRNYCKSENYSNDVMKDMLDWEIYRMIAYYINFSYMKENEFNFATLQQLDIYICRPEVKKKLCNLFISYNNHDEREKEVIKYLKIYYDDRKRKRKVIFSN